jgi:hypothetical protein
MQKMFAAPASDKQPSDEAAERSSIKPFDEFPLPDLAFSDMPLEEIRQDESQVEANSENTEAFDHQSSGNIPVKDLMTPNPETIHEQETVAVALNKMAVGRFRHIPVEKDDGTYTVASIKSLLAYIAQEDW